jgi:hypothetical protein
MKRSGLEIDPSHLVAQMWGRAKGRASAGMEPIPKEYEPCRSPEHHPPSHICIPQGMQYRHVCPGCGAESVIRPMQVCL